MEHAALKAVAWMSLRPALSLSPGNQNILIVVIISVILIIILILIIVTTVIIVIILQFEVHHHGEVSRPGAGQGLINQLVDLQDRNEN